MSIQTHKCIGLSHAAHQMAVSLGSSPVKDERGVEVAYLTSPVVFALVPPLSLCPDLVALGNPFALLLSSYAWLVQPGGASRWPESLDPGLSLPDSSGASVIAEGIRENGRHVMRLGVFLVSFETVGDPENHGILDCNIIVAGGSAFAALGHWGVRWLMLHHAVCGCTGFICGMTNIVVLHPCASMGEAEKVRAECREVLWGGRGEGGNASVLPGGPDFPLVSGDAADWLRESRMFRDEHTLAMGYSDRFVSGVLSPAMTAWLALNDQDRSDKDRVSAAQDLVRSVRDLRWRAMLTRYLDMVRVD